MPNPIQIKSFAFSLAIIKLYQELQAAREFVLSKQLLRSATSVGANVEEAQAAKSRRDFASKMAIASKEARETHYWLRLLSASQLVPLDYRPYLKDSEELIKILTAIVKKAQQQNND